MTCFVTKVLCFRFSVIACLDRRSALSLLTQPRNSYIAHDTQKQPSASHSVTLGDLMTEMSNCGQILVWLYLNHHSHPPQLRHTKPLAPPSSVVSHHTAISSFLIGVTTYTISGATSYHNLHLPHWCHYLHHHQWCHTILLPTPSSVVSQHYQWCHNIISGVTTLSVVSQHYQWCHNIISGVTTLSVVSHILLPTKSTLLIAITVF